MKIIYGETARALDELDAVMNAMHHVHLDGFLAKAVRERRDFKTKARKRAFDWVGNATIEIREEFEQDRFEKDREYDILKNASRLKSAMNSGNFKTLQRVKPLMDLVNLIQEQKDSSV